MHARQPEGVKEAAGADEEEMLYYYQSDDSSGGQISHTGIPMDVCMESGPVCAQFTLTVCH